MSYQKLPPPVLVKDPSVDRWMNLLYNNVNIVPTTAPPVATDLPTTLTLVNDIRARLLALGIYK